MELTKLEVKTKDIKRNISASRIRVSDTTKSYVPGSSKSKVSQKDKARQAMDKFGRMLDQFSLEQLFDFHFHQFLCFHMRRYKGQSVEETIKGLRYPPKNRQILH